MKYEKGKLRVEIDWGLGLGFWLGRIGCQGDWFAIQIVVGPLLVEVSL